MRYDTLGSDMIFNNFYLTLQILPTVELNSRSLGQQQTVFSRCQT